MTDLDLFRYEKASCYLQLWVLESELAGASVIPRVIAYIAAERSIQVVETVP